MSSPPTAPPTYGPLPRPAEPEKGRTFPCERCGADLVFHIGAQKLKCEHCGFEKDLEFSPEARVEERDLEAGLNGLAARRREAHPAPAGAQELSCAACGATVVFQGTLTATSCAYCGEPVQRERAHAAADRIPVDGLLTFGVPAEQARGSLAAWVKGLWFAPTDFTRQGLDPTEARRLEAVYLPFFTYDAMTATTYTGERGEHYYVTVKSGNQTRQEQRTRWWPASGSFQRFFDDVVVPAFRSLPAALLQKLEPWPLERCVPFTEGALAGKLAHTYDLELGAGFGRAKERIEGAIEEEVRERIGGDVQRVHSVRTQFAGLTYKHLLLPVWLLAYRYRGKSYRVAVNAVTGEVHGERPWSAVKIVLAAAVALLVGLTVAYLAHQ